MAALSMRCAAHEYIYSSYVYVSSQHANRECQSKLMLRVQIDAVLRVTKLLRNATNAVGTSLSLAFKAPCNTPAGFLGPAGGPFTYFLAETSSQVCCPGAFWKGEGGGRRAAHDG